MTLYLFTSEVELKLAFGVYNAFLFHVCASEVTGELRKLHNEELNDLYSLPNIVRVVKSK